MRLGNLGVFVDRQTLGNAEQLTALLRIRDTTEQMGHFPLIYLPGGH
jgi:hypothetical protein